MGAAVANIRPFGVDVATGVEMAPGVKDPRKVMAFITAVREAESGRVHHPQPGSEDADSGDEPFDWSRS